MLRWIAISLTASCLGCTTLPTTTAFKQKWESMQRRPNRLIVSVAPNFIEKDGFPFHQGMYVRVHFFLNDEPLTMVAEGEMTFVAYDKSKNGDPLAGGDLQPVGVYRIAADELPKHLRKDIIGDSYIFWLPYEPETPTQMVVNASFKPKYGEPFTSEPSVVHLTPLKHAVATANAADKKKPRPNYVAFDSMAPKRTAEVSTIALNNKPGTSIHVPTIGGATPINAGLVRNQMLQAVDPSRQQAQQPSPQQPPKPPAAN
jgi:hypothetical protein